MSVQDILKRTYTQTAVYWGNPKEDGFGGKTFDAPIEIKCRWEERQQVLTDAKGNIEGSRASVYILQDLDQQGFLYLGTLVGLTTDQKNDPTKVEGAWVIKQFEKVSELGSTTNFIRKVYLLIWQKR
jgi:hypothetical protein